MVATDLDGTLLSPEGIVSGRTAEAVRRAREAGIHVVPATGRPPKSVWDLAAVAGLGPLGVCSNGAALIDFALAEVVEWDRFEAGDAAELVRLVRTVDPDVRFAIDNLGPFTHEPDFFEMVVDWDEEITVVDDITTALADGAMKLIARRPGWHAVEYMALLEPVVGSRADLTTSGLDWVDVGIPLVSKASRLESVCTRLGLRAEEVLAIGDNHNDLAMLAWAGTSMAVANAVPEVLAVVDRVLASNAGTGPDHEDPTRAAASSMRALARSSAARARRREVAGTMDSATTSVRLCVVPPARKKRRRTRPMTTMAASASSTDAHAGASNHCTGTVSAGPASPRTVSSMVTT
jgi:Cof subfamily protein (haloacid dehalogenase superfamily)